LFHCGLSDGEKEIEINLSNDASSTFGAKGGEVENIKLIRLVDFLESNDLEKVDLIKINIEGGEYELLEDVIESGKSSLFENIQV